VTLPCALAIRVLHTTPAKAAPAAHPKYGDATNLNPEVGSHGLVPTDSTKAGSTQMREEQNDAAAGVGASAKADPVPPQDAHGARSNFGIQD